MQNYWMSWLWCHFCFADPEKYNQNSKNKLVEVCFVCWRCEWWSETAGFLIKFLLTSDFPVCRRAHFSGLWFAIAIIMVASCFSVAPSGCARWNCDRHHHGAFCFCLWLPIVLRSPSSWCFFLGRVLAGRFAIAIIMVVFVWVICLLSAFFETVLGQVCSQTVPFLLKLV